MSRPPNTQTASVSTETQKPYLSAQEAVSYLHSLGFTTATVETVKYHAYYTGKLPKPKNVGRRAYWARTDLDALVEKL